MHGMCFCVCTCHAVLFPKCHAFLCLQAHKALSKKKHELEKERHQVEKLQKKFSLIHKTLVASASLASPT